MLWNTSGHLKSKPCYASVSIDTAEMWMILYIKWTSFPYILNASDIHWTCLPEFEAWEKSSVGIHWRLNRTEWSVHFLHSVRLSFNTFWRVNSGPAGLLQRRSRVYCSIRLTTFFGRSASAITYAVSRDRVWHMATQFQVKLWPPHGDPNSFCFVFRCVWLSFRFAF